MCYCKCVFIDVGANDGQTLLDWPHQAAAQLVETKGMRRRAGMFPGLSASRWTMRQAPATRGILRRCMQKHSINQTCFYGFEGSRRFTSHLNKLRNHYLQTAHNVAVFTETVFAMQDGLASFETHEGKVASLGSRIGNGDHSSPAPGANKITIRNVTSVNGSRFLEEISDARFSGHVALKLDVEGFEYQILEDLLSTGAVCAPRLNLVAVEWHSPGNSSAFTPRSASELVRRLESSECNTTTMAWV